jgi:RNA polymerase sigma factor (sigma-70 family)
VLHPEKKGPEARQSDVESMIMTNGIRAENHVGLAFLYASRRSRVENIADWHNLVGPSYEGLVHAARYYDPSLGNHFSTYAWRCMAGKVSTALKKDRSRRPTVSLEQCDEPIAPNGRSHALCIHELTEKALRRLSERERMILGRTVMGGAYHRIVAEDLGVTRQAVSETQRNALRKCREALEDSA